MKLTLRLTYRYLSHYRSIHRGQFFTTMKSTAVRKLLPESWGFVCPVHTPGTTLPVSSSIFAPFRLFLEREALVLACFALSNPVSGLFWPDGGPCGLLNHLTSV